jgi:membrane-associated protein
VIAMTSPAGLLGLFAMIVADGVVPLVPGEAALLASAPAALAAGWPAVVGLAVLAATAAFLGDATAYHLGRRVGTDRFAWQRRERVARLLDRTGETLERRGTGLVATARMLPGWRVAVVYMAGATGMPWRRFALASALGAVLWAAYLLLVGTTVGALTGGGAIVVSLVSLVVTAVLAQTVRWVGRTRLAQRVSSVRIRSISAIWPAITSVAMSTTIVSSPWATSSSAISTAPRWCWTMPVR